MKFSAFVRRVHRWMSIVFTASAILVAALGLRAEPPAEWVYLLPLAPLALMLATGLYLFALPYVARARA